jgi:hypothetical protein
MGRQLAEVARLSPVNWAIQDGSDAVITPGIPQSSQEDHLQDKRQLTVSL